jgi:hypothetical protein
MASRAGRRAGRINLTYKKGVAHFDGLQNEDHYLRTAHLPMPGEITTPNVSGHRRYLRRDDARNPHSISRSKVSGADLPVWAKSTNPLLTTHGHHPTDHRCAKSRAASVRGAHYRGAPTASLHQTASSYGPCVF